MSTRETSPYVVLLLIGLTIILGFATYKVSLLRSDLEALREANLRLEDELRRITAPVFSAEASEGAPALEDLSHETKPAPPLNSAQLNHHSNVEPHTGGGAEWHAAQTIKQLEELVALSPSQREALSSSIGAFYSQGARSGREQEYTEILRREMGEDLYSQYEQKKAQTAEQEFQQRINDDVIILTNKLSLSSEQEERLRNVLEQVERAMQTERGEYEEKMREAMANHFEGDSGKEKLKQQFEEINQISKDMKKRKDSAVFDQTSDFLSDEQRNKLLELQARN